MESQDRPAGWPGRGPGRRCMAMGRRGVVRLGVLPGRPVLVSLACQKEPWHFLVRQGAPAAPRESGVCGAALGCPLHRGASTWAGLEQSQPGTSCPDPGASRRSQAQTHESSSEGSGSPCPYGSMYVSELSACKEICCTAVLSCESFSFPAVSCSRTK